MLALDDDPREDVDRGADIRGEDRTADREVGATERPLLRGADCMLLRGAERALLRGADCMLLRGAERTLLRGAER